METREDFREGNFSRLVIVHGGEDDGKERD